MNADQRQQLLPVRVYSRFSRDGCNRPSAHP